MESLLYKFNPWWETEYVCSTHIRSRYLDQLMAQLSTKDIMFLTGLRRVGKTTLLQHVISHLVNSGDPKHVLYVSLDSLALRDYTIHEIIDTYRQLMRFTTTEFIYVFLDEVTAKTDFNQELKNLYDLGNIKLFVSSSSASQLHEKKAYLTGRARYIEIEPLSFQEFLQFRNYSVAKKDAHLLNSYFREYMEIGGMPEYVLEKDPRYISDVVQNILYKDIIAKYNIKNSEKVIDLFRLLVERVGKPISYVRLANILDISKDSVQQYISYFIETFLFYKIEMQGKLNERIKGPKKIYCADVGIKNVVHGFKDLGAIYENLVFLELKARNTDFLKKIHFVYEGGIEIDFLYDGTLIEAKFGQEMTEKQQKLFDSFKAKHKIIAKGVDFFL